MTSLILYVKGTPDVATREAESRGFAVHHHTPMRKDGSETRLSVEGSEEVAAHWLCEPGDCLPGRGYEAGTLLFYR
jgi:hypothetical protein